VKRRELERHLRDHGAELLREGGRHSYWGFDPERSTAVPRHREIAWPLAREVQMTPDLVEAMVEHDVRDALARPTSS
jgi:mRNA interferase HicA